MLIEVAVNVSKLKCFNCIKTVLKLCILSLALGFSNATMNSARMMPKRQGWNSKWLAITIFSFLCLWSLDFSLAAPIRQLPDPSKPSTESVDSVSEKDVLVR